jgi:hypothetical protein
MKYVIFFQPRSGSTYIASRLNDPDSGLVNGFEIINPETASSLGLLTNEEYADFSRLAKKQVLRRFYAKFDHVPLVGCKVAPYQVSDDLPGFFQAALAVVDKSIFLIRKNPVQVAISQIWALRRATQNQLTCLVEGEENTVPTMKIDRGEFEYYVISSIVERDLVLALAKIPRQALTLTYEDYFGDQNHAFGRIREFLEVRKEAVLPESKLVRVRASSPSGYIENYDEVREWTRHLGFDDALLDAAL